MKRSRDDILSLQSYKKQNRDLPNRHLTADPIDLPNDVQSEIFDHVIATNDLDLTMHSLYSLYCTNTNIRKIITEKIQRFNLIQNLGYRFYNSDENIAAMLPLATVINLLPLQTKLRRLCYNTNPLSKKISELNILMQQSVNLNFLFNCGKNFNKTPLMISAYNDENFFYHLLEQKQIDVNACNTYELTALHLAERAPINLKNLKKLLTHPNINVNQQNFYGETALLYFLKKRLYLNRIAKRQITPSLHTAVRLLIEHGTDVTIPDIHGKTAADIIRQYSINRALNAIIEEAVIKKINSQQQPTLSHTLPEQNKTPYTDHR